MVSKFWRKIETYHSPTTLRVMLEDSPWIARFPRSLQTLWCRKHRRRCNRTCSQRYCGGWIHSLTVETVVYRVGRVRPRLLTVDFDPF